MGGTLFLAAVLLVVSAPVLAAGETWHVDGSLSDPGGGTSRQGPLKTIQEAMDAASEGDTVVVAQGTYPENIQFNGKNIIVTSTDPTDPAVVDSTIIDANQTGSVVAFLGSEDESCVLTGFTIRNGEALFGGGILGGTQDNHSWATIRHNIITANRARQMGCCPPTGGSGGGLAYCDGTIEYNIVTGNEADLYGGGLDNCHGTIRNNTVAGNSATLYGGGLLGCSGAIQNNLITANSAKEGAGLYYCDGKIQNNHITANRAGDSSGGLSQCNGVIQNCIIWGNTAASGAQLHGSSRPTYSCIQGWVGSGQGNTADDPQFVDANGPDADPTTYRDNNYRLAAGSPCIDAGKNDEWMWDAVDLDGNSRIVPGASSPTVDMGAYEYIPGTFVFFINAAEGGARLVWTSEPGSSYIIWSRSDLAEGPWNEEVTVVSRGQATTWTDPDVGHRRKFYRIEIE